MKVSFNHKAFQDFVAGLAKLYFEEKGMITVDIGGIRKAHDPHFHAHSDDFFTALKREMTIGTGGDLIRLYGGLDIIASVPVWQKLIVEWRRVLLRREPVLIVLDKYQTEWCSPESQGRFSIEYRPDIPLSKEGGI